MKAAGNSRCPESPDSLVTLGSCSRSEASTIYQFLNKVLKPKFDLESAKWFGFQRTAKHIYKIVRERSYHIVETEKCVVMPYRRSYRGPLKLKMCVQRRVRGMAVK